MHTHMIITRQMATTWLNGNIENVIAVHCLGGKGRTGTLCASLLLWTAFSASADAALAYFQKRLDLVSFVSRSVVSVLYLETGTVE